MKTVRLSKMDDGSYRTEDGAFIVTGFSGDFKICIIKGETGVGDHYSTLVSDLSSLRCARVWIKNFYRTLTIKPDEYRTLKHGERIQKGDEAYTWVDPDCTTKGWMKLDGRGVVDKCHVPVHRKREFVPLLAGEQSAVNNIDTFLPKVGKFTFVYDAENEPNLVHLKGTIHYFWVPVAEFYLSNTYNY